MYQCEANLSFSCFHCGPSASNIKDVLFRLTVCHIDLLMIFPATSEDNSILPYAVHTHRYTGLCIKIETPKPQSVSAGARRK